MNGRQFKDSVYEQFARAGAALSSAKRIEMVDLLAQGERSVDSIAKASAQSVANASRHLQVLRRSGLVLARRAGNFTFYRLADDSVIEAYRALRAMAESRIAEVRELATAFFDHVDGVEPIGIEELIERTGSGDVVLVDVRPRLEFDARHIPGAMNIPLDEIADRISELDSASTIVAYCRGPYCVFSAEAVALLRAAGLRARRFSGGPFEWRAHGLSLVGAGDEMSCGSLSSWLKNDASRKLA